MFMLLGMLVGFVGALVGAGGGFLVMPVLLLAGGLEPARAAAVSLVMVAVSAASGTFTYVRQRQVDVVTGLCMAALALPGSLLGARLTDRLSVSTYAAIFGAVLAAAGFWMALGPGLASVSVRRSRWLSLRRQVRTRAGQTYSYAVPLLPVGAAVGLTGGVASLFGIGGGPIVVPLLTFAGNLPVHVATATSQLIILLSSIGGVVGYVLAGKVDWGLALALSVGALVGAPLGALASPHVPARRLLQVLGVCLLVAGGRLVVR